MSNCLRLPGVCVCLEGEEWALLELTDALLHLFSGLTLKGVDRANRQKTKIKVKGREGEGGAFAVVRGKRRRKRG